LELRDEVDEHFSARADSSPEPGLPARERVDGLGQDVADELPEGVDKGRIWDAPVELVELPCDEVPLASGDALVNLLAKHRLADAGVARDEEQLGLALGRAVPCAGDRKALPLATIQLLGKL